MDAIGRVGCEAHEVIKPWAPEPEKNKARFARGASNPRRLSASITGNVSFNCHSSQVQLCIPPILSPVPLSLPSSRFVVPIPSVLSSVLDGVVFSHFRLTSLHDKREREQVQSGCRPSNSDSAGQLRLGTFFSNPPIQLSRDESRTRSFQF